jgi:hypothetical protein
MKTVVIVAPHFLPGFLPSVHRSRLWAYHLQEFGWKPVILATDPQYYECQVLPEMLDLLPPGLEVIRTRALPVKPLRLVGDIGTRSLYWYWRALAGLARSRKVDFLLFTIPACVPALLGPCVYRRFGIPYGIDYIDPWVPETPQHYRVFSKPWLADRVSEILEPLAVRDARLICGINKAYFESVLRRNPRLASRAVTAGMPYGGSDRDYEALDRKPRKLFLFDPGDGLTHIVYAGALLPKAFEVLDRLLAGIAMMRATNPGQASRLRLHFVGTGVNEGDPGRGHTVKPYIEKYGLADLVSELPSRIGYLDVLNHLRHATAILAIGSTEPHYAPSKIYQAFMSKRPLLALLHEKSTAVATVRASRAGQVITFNESALPAAADMAAALERFLEWAAGFDCNTVDGSVFESVSARETTRVLADAMDRALDLERASSAPSQ